MNARKSQAETAEVLPVSELSLPRLPLGFSAGDLLEVTEREIQRLLKEAKGDQQQAVKLALGQLLEKGQITPYDAECLGLITDKVFALERGEYSGERAAADIGEIYYAMLADPRSSSAAASGASVVFAAARSKLDEPFVAMTLMGMMAGLGIGAAVGNPIAGAAIGGVVGALVSRCVPEDINGDGGDSED